MFLDKERGNLFIIEPDAPKDPEGAVKLINEAAARNPALNMFVYYVPTLGLTSMAHEQDSHMPLPHVSVENALSGLDPKIGRGTWHHDDIERLLSHSFKTDHHWTIEGAHVAYGDVLDMMRQVHPDIGEPIALQPDSAFAVDTFRGMLSSVSAYDAHMDTVSDGGMDIPEHILHVRAPSGKLMAFDSVAQTRSELVDGLRKPTKYEDLYGSFFLLTELYVWHEYPQNQTGRKLLLLADSVRKPIAEPIASHFDATDAV